MPNIINIRKWAHALSSHHCILDGFFVSNFSIQRGHFQTPLRCNYHSSGIYVSANNCYNLLGIIHNKACARREPVECPRLIDVRSKIGVVIGTEVIIDHLLRKIQVNFVRRWQRVSQYIRRTANKCSGSSVPERIEIESCIGPPKINGVDGAILERIRLNRSKTDGTGKYGRCSQRRQTAKSKYSSAN